VFKPLPRRKDERGGLEEKGYFENGALMLLVAGKRLGEPREHVEIQKGSNSPYSRRNRLELRQGKSVKWWGKI